MPAFAAFVTAAPLLQRRAPAPLSPRRNLPRRAPHACPSARPPAPATSASAPAASASSPCDFVFDEPARASLLNANTPARCPPLLLYIPGLDCAALPSAQAARVRRSYTVVSLCLRPTDRSTWSALVCSVLPQLRALRDNSEAPLTVVAESFGAVLALALAAESSAHDSPFARLVLLNPATSIASDAPVQTLSSWLRILQFDPTPTRLTYRAVSIILYNALLVDTARLPEPRGDAAGVAQSFDTVRAPLEATLHRLGMLRELPPHLADDALLAEAVTVPVTLVASRRDRLLRSVAEARRLGALLPGATEDVLVLEESAHAALLEAGVDLSAILRHGEQPPHGERTGRDAGLAADDARANGSDAKADEKRLSYTAALRLGQQFYGRWRALVSPLVLGREHIIAALRAAGDNRPVLFVGNHGIHGIFDTSLVFLELVDMLPSETRLRALADPAHFNQYAELSGGRWTQFADDLGAVEATARNYYRLLATSQRILLFPGGAREVCRRRGEQNTLVWREDETQFVRPAARFDAIIVPFSSVGADDAVDIVLDGQELLRLPVVGPKVRELARDGDYDTERLMPIITLPPRADRFYFQFHAPVDLSSVSTRDEAECDAAYDEVRAAVARGIENLQRVRDRDPRRPFRARALSKAPGKVLDRALDAVLPLFGL